MRTIITYLIFSFVLLFNGIKAKSQTANEGIIAIMPGEAFSTVSDFENKGSGDLINDGELFLYKNFNNDGLTTFTKGESSGITHFVGNTGYQNITGSIPIEWYNVEFKNTQTQTAFYLSNEATVHNQVSFNNGIIDTDTYNGKFVFNENAHHVNTSDLSFVRGKVVKKGVLNFEFPTGHSNFYRPSFHGNSNTHHHFISSYFKENSDTLYSHSQKEEDILTINENEFWVVEKETGDENIVLSLSIDSDTTPALFFENNPDLKMVIVRWDKVAKKWINEGGEVSDPELSNDKTTLITTQVKGYGIFTMALITKLNDIPDAEDLIIYNGISPNGDGINDTFLIKGINQYADNTVEIYNRWGVKVFETHSYNETDNVFRGYSNGRATVNRDSGLPEGTYYYILKYNNGKKSLHKAGYLYLTGR
ncbi:gliding motility-associated C-terminal domain-containing protein [Flavobacterium aquidurense]|uniref:gliding motility-associated C-terminal domain-containing protein n=1 Tax=Flavobacterium aquidurense TaxID=362413 RepID=UPI00371D49B1